jgi:hypothetical protein
VASRTAVFVAGESGSAAFEVPELEACWQLDITNPANSMASGIICFLIMGYFQ